MWSAVAVVSSASFFWAGILAAHILLVVLAVRSARQLKDVFTPVNILIGLAFARLSLPAAYFLFAQPESKLFELMGLTEPVLWYRANCLALLGLLSLLLGWILANPERRSSQLAFSQRYPIAVRRTEALAAVLALIIGGFAILWFVQSNIGIVQAIATGGFRTATIQGGTGKFFYLGLLAIPASLVIAARLLQNKRRSWIWAFLPILLVVALFAILGGRTRSLVPVAALALTAWYLRADCRLTQRRLLWSLAAGLLAVFAFLLIGLYRQGYDLDASQNEMATHAWANLAMTALFIEVGQLHTLAGALLLGGGALEGASLTTLLWPLIEFVQLPHRSTGVYIAEELVGFDDRPWGFHGSLIGDLYINAGMAGLIIGCMIFGFFLGRVYSAFRAGALGAPFYALVVVYCVRIFFEALDKYPEFLTIVVYLASIKALGHLLALASSRPMPPGAIEAGASTNRG
jgi:hypothetical protein